ncbi:hypothetical protein BDY21DRAFT_349285 [Lineolata rhizophorae]|uniref:Uncharacterized protein n=1 Tax=Lineolata rhizophorae TaxID=578093 RepID=A0A6A6NXJ4_9PEZI|nr:hypothetical protein BDY21DRAFT_349285 [Lineolata rhizophorae]
MSWSSKLGNWSGRFSPFGRGSGGQPSDVDDSYSYITDQDIRKLGANGAIDGAADPAVAGPPRDTDVLVLKHKRVSYPIHFPAYSIDRNELRIGEIRTQIARRLDIDAARVKLLYKGRNLKDDTATARQEGLRSEAEIMVVAGEGDAANSGMSGDSRAEKAWSVGSDEEDESSEDSGAERRAGESKPSKSRKKKKKGKRRSRKSGQQSAAGSEAPTPPPHGSQYVTQDHLPVPNAYPGRPASAASSARTQSVTPTPKTPMETLDSLAYTFHTTLVPDCVQFISSPPSDVAKRKFEHKKLEETIIQKVLLKTDAVETDGDESVRARRKEIVKEVQAMLTKLDEAVR